MHLYDITNRRHYRLVSTKAANGQRCAFHYAPGTAFLQPKDNPNGSLLAVPLSVLHEAIREGGVEVLSSQTDKRAKLSALSFRAMRRAPLEMSRLKDLGKRVKDDAGPGLGTDAHIAALKALRRSVRKNLFTPDANQRGTDV